PNVVRIQNRYAITPLSKWGTRFKPPRPKHVDLQETQFTVPGTSAGADQLRKFPPPARDRPLLKQLAAVGIGPGRHPSTESLDADTRAGLRAAVAAGENQVNTDLTISFAKGAVKDNGWLVARIGHYG